MKHVASFLGLTLTAFLFVGCNAAPKASPQKLKDQRMARLASMAGEWRMQDEQGVWQTASIFTVSSNGSIVREIMFPGQSHEMTNVYHMDGDTMLVTHYCAVGNQPRMRSQVLGAEGADALFFRTDSVTNLSRPDDIYMGEMTMKFLSDDTVEQQWQSLKLGQPVAGQNPVFRLHRKR